MSDATPTSPKAKQRRPILKWSLVTLGVLLSLVILLLVSLRLAAQSGFGRQFVESRIEAASPAGLDIEVEGLQGDLLGRFRIARLTIADDEGVWLVAEDILADWKPLALSRRALTIEALEADLIHVMRRPNLVSSNDGSGGGGSMPLRAGKLGKLAIGELRTDEGVLPRALSLAIDGEGRIGLDGGRSLLSVVPLQGDGDRLEADLSWSDDFRLTGKLDLSGPAGGLFASLARLEDSQAIAADFSGEGTLDDWTGEADIRIDEASAITASAQTQDGAIGFEINAFPRQHPLTRQVADVLGDELYIDGTASRDEDRQPQLDVTATAEGLSLTAQASQPASGNAYGADIRLAVDQPSRYAPGDSVSVGNGILAGMLVYDSGAVRFDGTVEASGVDLPSFAATSLSGPLSVVFDRPSVIVRTRLAAANAELPGMASQIMGAQPTLQLNAVYDLTDRSLSLREAILQGKAGRANAAGTLRLGSAFSADLAGGYTVDGARAGLARPVSLRGQFQARRQRAGETAITLTTNARNLGELPAPLSQWSDGVADLNARGTISDDGTVSLPRIALSSGTLRLDGNARYAGGELDAEADLSAGEATIAGMALSGLSGRASVSGPTGDLAFDTQLAAQRLTGEGIGFAGITLDAAGRYTDGALDATATLDAESSQGQLTAETAIALNGANWRVSGFDGQWGNLTAQATLQGSGGDIASFQGEASVNGDLPEGLPAEAINADMRLDGERVVLDAALERFAFGPAEAEAFILRATGTPDAIEFVAEMDGRTELNALSYDTILDLDGTLNGLASGAVDLTANLSAMLGDVSIETEAPLRFQQFDDGFDVSGRIAMLGGTLVPEVTTRGETSIRLEGRGLRMAPLLILAGRPGLDGTLGLDVDFRETEAGNLAGDFSAELASLARPGSDLPPVDLLVSGTLAPDALNTRVEAGDNDSLSATVDMTVPVRTMEGPPFIQPVENPEIPFEAQADGQIEAVSALLVPPNMVMRGVVDLDLEGRLPHLNETFEGTLGFREGQFEHGDLGMVLNRIEADATLGNGSVTLDRLDARGRSGGTLSGSGTMAVDGSAFSDVRIEAKELVVTERREGRATVSGTMELRQQPDLLEIIGDLTVDKGEINIENLPQGGPPTLDVRFDEPSDAIDSDAEEDEAATRLDISLRAPGQIDVRGRGVNAELALDANVGGSLGKPVITGSARIVRGRFDLIGKRFQFAESTLQFEPDVSSSTLNVAATHETRDDITAILRVDGTIERPEITLTSDPVLPEDEVLSRVLFGRSPTQLSGLEAARLAAALAQLSGGGGFDLLGGIERALGLDTFDVGSGSNGQVQVTSGKYLTQDVYLELRSSASGAPGVAIEWEPVNNIEVEAATSTEEGQQLSIQWKRDFDDGVFPGISCNSKGRGEGSCAPERAETETPDDPEPDDEAAQ